MRSRSSFLFAALVVLMSAPPASVYADDQVYRWVDANGVPHYSDSLPPEDVVSAREITVRGQPVARATSEASTEPDTTAAPVTTAASIAASRKQFCERAKENLNTLQISGDVMQDIDGDGIQDLLSAEQRDAERKRAQNAITFYCEE